ncbi:MAG: adenylosuccinate synthase, partial [Bacteroidota bacterium]
GWNQDVSHCKKWSDLPEALLHYIAFIEQAVGVPINLVSLGPDRAQTLFK